MGNIHYDPEQILNGFTVDSLKDLAKRLKRRIRVIKSDIIQDILSPPRGRLEDRAKIWQEINRNLRKELEVFSEEEFKILSLSDTPLAEQCKVSYMLTLSSNPEIRAMGEELYCQAMENKVIEKAEKVEGDEENESNAEDQGDEEALAVLAMITVEEETREIEVPNQTSGVIELSARQVIEHIDPREASFAKLHARGQGTELTKELQKRIKTLEKKLKRTNSEALRAKEQLEKLNDDWIAINAQRLKAREESEKYRKRVRELEVERIENNKVIEILKNKLEQSQQDNLPNVKLERSDEIDLAAFQGRKALIFAERDQQVDIRLNALGIIPIWAMEIDWKRPRRRMSTCEVVLYKNNQDKLEKLQEIRDIARYLNIPCSELLNV